MKRFSVLFMMLLSIQVLSVCAGEMQFTIAGPEDTYNQIRVVNETSQETFTCRVVKVNEYEGGQDELYGVYNLRAKMDEDSNTKWINRGTKLAVQMPNDFPVEVSFSVEYIDRPFFDYIVIHIFDAGTFDTK